MENDLLNLRIIEKEEFFSTLRQGVSWSMANNL